MTINETIIGPDNEPTVHEQTKIFLDAYFSRTPEQIESDYYDLAAANSLLADEKTPQDYQDKADTAREAILQTLYPTQDVLRLLKDELSTELEAKILMLDAQASLLAEDPDTANLFRAVVRATMDIGLTLSTGVTYEYADQLGIGGTGRPEQDEFSISGGGPVGISQKMQQIALSDWNGSANHL